MDCQLEEDPISKEEGKKRQRSDFLISKVSNVQDSLDINGVIQLTKNKYRRLPVGMPTGSHEDFMQECSRIGEFASNTSSSAYAKNLSSPYCLCLLYGDKVECYSNGKS